MSAPKLTSRKRAPGKSAWVRIAEQNSNSLQRPGDAFDVYMISICKSDGVIGCACNGWKFRKTCSHVDTLRTDLAEAYKFYVEWNSAENANAWAVRANSAGRKFLVPDRCLLEYWKLVGASSAANGTVDVDRLRPLLVEMEAELVQTALRESASTEPELPRSAP